jgi:rfaE bifunctional protein nucleotidyltransferase chain/domain
MTQNKIIPFGELSTLATKLKSQGKKLVLCHGVFDLLHPGHFKHFEAARKFGDILFVTISADRFVNKGPGRPIFNENLRAETLAAIQLIDYVSINYSNLANTIIEAIKPDFYVKGQDYKIDEDDITGGIIDERNKVEEFGGKLVFTEEIQFSSTKLINQNLDFAKEDVKEYLNRIRILLPFEKIKQDLEKISQFKVLVIGDIILDEYTFVEPLGKASKSATITAKKLYGEVYAGGVLAVANHISNFVQNVTLVSTYGINFGHNYLDFIRDKLHRNIQFKPVFCNDRPTVLKRRYLDRIFKNKLFEIIEIEDTPLPPESKKELLINLKKLRNTYDLVVISDFGHGLFDPEIINHILSQNIFVSVNAQTNSANRGFNLLTKYPRCNYFSIDENECRLAMADKYSDISLLLSELMQKTKAELAAITLGVKGSMVRSKQSLNPVVAPVLSNEIVDTIGAGDAYLSITSLLAKNGNSPEEIAFIGNAVGAMAVKILGNKSFIEKVPLMKYLKTLLTSL